METIKLRPVDIERDFVNWQSGSRLRMNQQKLGYIRSQGSYKLEKILSL